MFSSPIVSHKPQLRVLRRTIVNIKNHPKVPKVSDIGEITGMFTAV